MRGAGHYVANVYFACGRGDPRQTVNLGARYRFALGPYRALLRGQVTNLLNDYSWFVSPAGGIVPTNSRSWTLQLAADFCSLASPC